jgi:DNA-binding GntR family transcriptional regulator
VTQLSLDLDRSSPVPLYFQVARQIEVAIENGQLAPGERLENEVGLADRFGLSRPTMRRAIQELVAKGLLVRKRGVGTQVVHGRVNRKLGLTSFHDDLVRLQQEPTTRVNSLSIGAADEVVAEQLGVPIGSDVLFLDRVRCALGQPLALMHNWLPIGFAPVVTAEQLAGRGLYELLRSSGVHMRVAKQRVGARPATLAESRQLGIGRGAPLLTTERTTYDDRGRAVEFGRHVYRSDSYSLEFTLVDA